MNATDTTPTAPTHRTRRWLPWCILAAALVAVAVAALVWLVPQLRADESHELTATSYTEEALSIIDRYAVYADGDEYQQLRPQLQERAEHATTFEEADAIITEGLTVAGGKHSALYSQSSADEHEATEPARIEWLDGGIALITLPEHSAADEATQRAYAQPVLDELRAHRADIRGAIVDLRGNNGGNMYPMLAAVSPLLPQGELLRFQQQGTSQPVLLTGSGIAVGSENSVVFAIDDGFSLSVPVAVLQDDATASSAEMTLLAFRGLDNARSFGADSAGYATVNVVQPLPRDMLLQLTVGFSEARTGEVFGEDPIAPDAPSTDPVADATAWLRGYGAQ